MTGYMRVGWGLGGLSGIVVFLGGWIYCVATYGFLLGGALGWIPAGIAAAIATVIVAFLWGPIAAGAAIWGINNSSATPPAPPTSASIQEAVGAQIASNAAAPPPEPLQAPPPPNMETVGHGVEEFDRTYLPGRMAAAVTYTMDCYNKLAAAPSWPGWDSCATYDLLGQWMSEATVRGGGSPTEFFAPYSVSVRQARAANAIKYDAGQTGDRISALKAILEQVLENRRLASAAAAADAAAKATTQATQPSFDCSRVTSVNLKLVCSTPSLAAADRELAGAYQQALANAPSPQVLKESQRDWIRRRSVAIADVEVLAAMYSDRTAQLNELSAGR